MGKKEIYLLVNNDASVKCLKQLNIYEYAKGTAMARNCFYKSELTEEENEIYDCLVKGFNSVQSTISLPKGSESLRRPVGAVKLDYPDFFYVDFSKIEVITSSHFRSVSPVYVMSEKEIKKTKIQLAQRTNTLLSSFFGETPIQTEMYLHDELLKTAIYSFGKKDSINAFTIVGALLDGECVCSGYASAFKYLADRAGLTSIVVEGEAVTTSERGMESGRHAWNMVELGGEYFHVDVTFDKTLRNAECSRIYLNASDAEIAEDHSADTRFDIPKSTMSRRPVPSFYGIRDVIAYLKKEAKLGKKYSELLAPFLKTGTISEFADVLVDSLSIFDEIWYNKILNFQDGGLRGAVGVIWKE